MDNAFSICFHVFDRPPPGRLVFSAISLFQTSTLDIHMWIMPSQYVFMYLIGLLRDYIIIPVEGGPHHHKLML